MCTCCARIGRQRAIPRRRGGAGGSRGISGRPGPVARPPAPAQAARCWGQAGAPCRRHVGQRQPQRRRRGSRRRDGRSERDPGLLPALASRAGLAPPAAAGTGAAPPGAWRGDASVREDCGSAASALPPAVTPSLWRHEEPSSPPRRVSPPRRELRRRSGDGPLEPPAVTETRVLWPQQWGAPASPQRPRPSGPAGAPLPSGPPCPARPALVAGPECHLSCHLSCHPFLIKRAVGACVSLSLNSPALAE